MLYQLLASNQTRKYFPSRVHVSVMFACIIANDTETFPYLMLDEPPTYGYVYCPVTDYVYVDYYTRKNFEHTIYLKKIHKEHYSRMLCRLLRLDRFFFRIILFYQQQTEYLGLNSAVWLRWLIRVKSIVHTLQSHSIPDSHAFAICSLHSHAPHEDKMRVSSQQVLLIKLRDNEQFSGAIFRTPTRTS